MANAFAHLADEPKRPLGASVLRERTEQWSIALCPEESSAALWLVEDDGHERWFTEVGHSDAIVVRVGGGSECALAGSFHSFPPTVRQVRIKVSGDEWWAQISAQGWLCLVPVATSPTTLVWLDDAGREHAVAELPPLSHAGNARPTLYGPGT